jgi:hypothetical protein
MTLGTGSDFLGCSGGNDLPALVAGVGAEVYDPIGGFHDLKVVLDDEDGVAGVHQSLEDFEEHAHIVEVQAGGRFVEEKEGGGRRGKAPIAECGAELPGSARTIASARWRTSFRRWLSPPERVLMGWPSRR